MKEEEREEVRDGGRERKGGIEGRSSSKLNTHTHTNENLKKFNF